MPYLLVLHELRDKPSEAEFLWRLVFFLDLLRRFDSHQYLAGTLIFEFPDRYSFWRCISRLYQQYTLIVDFQYECDSIRLSLRLGRFGSRFIRFGIQRCWFDEDRKSTRLNSSH